MGELTSSSVPPIGPDDHLRGAGEDLIVYIDLGCAACAAAWPGLRDQGARLAFRHFPLASRRPRSPALHAAAEAAGRQGRFFEMVDSLFADRGHVDDPHLWARCEEIGIDREQFEADRRSDQVEARVRRDFESGIRAGVAGTPALFEQARQVSG